MQKARKEEREARRLHEKDMAAAHERIVVAKERADIAKELADISATEMAALMESSKKAHFTLIV